MMNLTIEEIPFFLFSFLHLLVGRVTREVCFVLVFKSLGPVIVKCVLGDVKFEKRNNIGKCYLWTSYSSSLFGCYFYSWTDFRIDNKLSAICNNASYIFMKENRRHCVPCRRAHRQTGRQKDWQTEKTMHVPRAHFWPTYFASYTVDSLTNQRSKLTFCFD